VRLERVLPSHLTIEYGNVEHCVERMRMLCLADARLPGLQLDPGAIRACTAAENDDTVLTLVDDRPLRCTLAPGRSPGNQPCIFDLQCSSGVCQKARGSLRGFCAANLPMNEGDKCQMDRCGGGLRCIEGKCVAAGTPGGGRYRYEIKPGMTCDPKNDEVSSLGPRCLSGLTCDPKKRKCVKNQYADLDEPCRDGCKRGRCIDGEYCALYIFDGEPCQRNYPQQCAPPASCFEGRCAIDPAPTGEP